MSEAINTSRQRNKDDEHAAIRSFCRILGWSRVRRKQYEIPDHVARGSNPIITWYESGDLDDVYLLINREPEWCAAVYALRYRIFSRWHGFRLSADRAVQKSEADRLSPCLERR